MDNQLVSFANFILEKYEVVLGDRQMQVFNADLLEWKSQNKEKVNFPFAHAFQEEVLLSFGEAGTLKAKIQNQKLAHGSNVYYDVMVCIATDELGGKQWTAIKGINAAYVSKLKDRKLPALLSAPERLEEIHQMCVQSLPPDVFEKWEEVMRTLIETRSDLR